MGKGSTENSTAALSCKPSKFSGNFDFSPSDSKIRQILPHISDNKNTSKASPTCISWEIYNKFLCSNNSIEIQEIKLTKYRYAVITKKMIT